MPISVNPNLNRRIRLLLYQLKRQFGGPITVYKLVSAETVYDTGIKTKFYTITRIPRGIILPVKVAREIATSITIVAANKMMVYGGSYDAGTRQFIIDAQDVPSDFNFSKDDFILYNNRRYEIKSYEEFEFHTGWNVVGKETFAEPQVPNTYHYLHQRLSRTNLALNQTSEATTEGHIDLGFSTTNMSLDQNVELSNDLYQRSSITDILLDQSVGVN
jgi:hypothetical protein